VLPDDVQLLHQCSNAALHPDGRTAVVSVLRPDLETDEYRGGLWLVTLDGADRPHRLTRGHRDTAPAISPDGELLAFLRAEPGGKPQLHLLELGGGEPVRLTDHPLGAGAPRWSPGPERRLAYVARVPEPGRYGTEDGVGPDAEPPRLVSSLADRVDGVGYTRDRRQHLFVLDVPDLVDATTASGALTEPRQLTGGDFDDVAVAWSPDGTTLYFCSDRHETRDGDLRRGLHAVAVGGGEPRPVAAGDLNIGAVEPSPDGHTLYLLATETGESGVEFVARNTGLFTVPADSSTAPQRLTDAETVDLGEVGSHLTVTADGVLVQNRARGAVHLLRVPRGGGEPQVLLDGSRQVRSHVASPDGTVVLAVVADPTSSGELARVRDGAAHPLTDFAEPLHAKGVRPPQEVTVTADDGYPVHGWAVLPDPERFGDGPHPVLLNIHGGPYAQYGWGLFDEAQVYAGAGYAVLMANPRGSAGYGQAHGAAIQHAVGQRDAADLLQFLDGALAREDLALDAGRVGVMGGSYGGYMTALLTTRTDRFAAAVVERGYLDASSFVGSADIGWFFPDGYHGSPEAMREQSPMGHVDAVTTPTLVIHSEQDWRCPVEQGQRWFTALKRNGVDAELLLFPGEGHELSRSGRPRHRVARFEHLLTWWARHLPIKTP
jgi:dipeptidyl aminopeptidase/acylaminoacyl peptidase